MQHSNGKNKINVKYQTANNICHCTQTDSSR